jgi:pre-mRNA-splicing factor ATP-dependent RNA helicase DHX38/PRP16
MSGQSHPAGEGVNGDDDFVHQIAIEMSRVMNSINPNDLLAKRIIDIARGNRSAEAFLRATSTFGKFPEDTMLGLHTRILVHLSQTAHQFTRSALPGRNGEVKEEEKVDGMDHDSSDRMLAEPRRKGGLMQSGSVRWFSLLPSPLLT